MDDEHISAQESQYAVYDDFQGIEPVLGNTTIQHQLERADCDCDQSEAEDVKTDFWVGIIVGHKEINANQSQEAKGQIDKEDPAPGVKLRQPPAQCGADDRTEHHAYAKKSHGLTMASSWKCI